VHGPLDSVRILRERYLRSVAACVCRTVRSCVYEPTRVIQKLVVGSSLVEASARKTKTCRSLDHLLMSLAKKDTIQQTVLEQRSFYFQENSCCQADSHTLTAAILLEITSGAADGCCGGVRPSDRYNLWYLVTCRR